MVKKKINITKEVNIKIVMDEIEMARALARIAHQIVENNKGPKDIVLVGIIQRGLPLARRLAALIKAQEGIEVPVGALDVSLYRDDLNKKGEYIEVRQSDMPFTVTDKTVVLVDDVIYAGRTARAALDGIKDYGRASKVQLAALIDRGHRELPIQPNFVGKLIPTSKEEDVKVDIVEIDGSDRVMIR